MPHAARSHVSVCPVFGEVLAEGWRAVELGAGFGVPFARDLDEAGGCHVDAALASAGAAEAADAATTMSAKSRTHRRTRPRASPAPLSMAKRLVPAATTRFRLGSVIDLPAYTIHSDRQGVTQETGTVTQQ